MGRALSNKNVQCATFEFAEFEGEWLKSFGKPELRGAWLIFGKSGCGKTTFALMLCKYLSQWGKVIYDSLEQGLSLSFQQAWMRCKMGEIGNRICLVSKEDFTELCARLSKRKSADIVLIDSLTAMDGFGRREFNALQKKFPKKLFIFLAHEKNHIPDPAIAEHVRRLSEVKIHVEGFKAFVTTRFEDAENGWGGEPFTIWQQGADEYWPENFTGNEGCDE